MRELCYTAGILSVLLGGWLVAIAFRGGNDLHIMGGALIGIGGLGLAGMARVVGLLMAIEKNTSE